MFKIQMIRGLACAALLSIAAAPLAAQIQPIDPNEEIDSDLAPLPPQGTGPMPDVAPPPAEARAASAAAVPPAASSNTARASAEARSDTYQKGDLIGAAEGVFGKGAAGLAGLIEDILQKQGEPNAYITGSEASGAFVVGLRYGSGELHHKVEGERKAYWTGPSVGFDVGGNAAKTFVLVYNLYDTEDLYKRYPAGEGAAYFVGGFNVSYLRSGDVVMIPVRLGAGLRLGANIGYMKFSKKGKWMPF